MSVTARRLGRQARGRSDADVVICWHSRNVRRFQRRLAALGAVLALAVALAATALPAQAHQPVELGPSDSTPARGPLLVDGTVSFAVYADVKRGDRRGFRFNLDERDTAAVQFLIIDERPANQLRPSQLPFVVVTDPSGERIRLAVNERTPFFEPYGGTNFLYLSRIEREAKPGEYEVSVIGRAPQRVRTVIAVGYREVPGEVRRG